MQCGNVMVLPLLIALWTFEEPIRTFMIDVIFKIFPKQLANFNVFFAFVWAGKEGVVTLGKMVMQ